MTNQLDLVLDSISKHRERLVASVVHLNDTYLVDERPDQGVPGFARVISSIKKIRSHTQSITGKPRTLVLHSGDFLAPSRVSTRTGGKLLVELLDTMGLDFCTLGNHEFDFGARTLVQRLQEASFRVVLANATSPSIKIDSWVHWPADATPLVAITGIVSESVFKSFSNDWRFSSPGRALEQFNIDTASIPFKLILTHATRAEDRQFRRLLKGRSYILGGHDHDIHWEEDDGPLILKNLSNLQTVRVILLLAGGKSLVLDLLERHRNIELSRVCDGRFLSAVPHYPSDVEALLKDLHPMEKDIVENAFESADSTIPHEPKYVQPSLEQEIKDFWYDDVRVSYTLEAAIETIPVLRDELQIVLKRDDHEGPDALTESLIQQAMPDRHSEDQLIRDFTCDAVSSLEARDEYLRRGPTDFGLFITECVRRRGKASIAIIHAGAFRCDSTLGRRFRLVDLRDTFLYDSPTAVVVIALDRYIVESLLTNGCHRHGEGAYPQRSPADVPDGDRLIVAISSYLLTNERSVDGYDDSLARALGIAALEAREFVKGNSMAWFSIEHAVLAEAQNVSYQSWNSESTTNLADDFIKLGALLYEELKASKIESFQLLSKDEVLDNRRLMELRNSLRDMLRNVPECHQFEDARQRLQAYSGPDKLQSVELQEAIVAHGKAVDRLRRLYEELLTHVEGFRRKIPFSSLLNYLAQDIGGWRR